MFRFSIRDVLWLTVVVALAVGWWLQRQDARGTLVINQELSAQNKQLNARLEIAEWWAKKFHEYYRRPGFMVPGEPSGAEQTDVGDLPEQP